MQGLGDTSAFDTFDRMAERIQLMEAEAEAGAELAGELSGDTLERKFHALEAGGGARGRRALRAQGQDGLLEAPKGENAKQLGPGAKSASAKGDDKADIGSGGIASVA